SQTQTVVSITTSNNISISSQDCSYSTRISQCHSAIRTFFWCPMLMTNRCQRPTTITTTNMPSSQQ
ncbi:hypothetical protein GIB67_039814, partial [Kingdonia uniflora]